MGRQRRERSWVRLLLTSVIAGAGLAALRSYLRPAAPPPANSSTASAPVGLRKSPPVPEPEPEPESQISSQPQTDGDAIAESVPVPAGGLGGPELAFVAEPTAPMYLPPASQGSRWDPPTG